MSAKISKKYAKEERNPFSSESCSVRDTAYVVIRVEDNVAAETVLTDAGFHLISEADVCKL